MAKRKAISKKTRFEVFKRDSFTCQYCGLTAPEVVLHLDHIQPVSKGGDNDILNLITACFDCNMGKKARLLSDNSAVQKQRDQLNELQERREQIEMMIEWRNGLKVLTDDAVEIAVEAMDAATPGWVTSTSGKQSIGKLVKQYGLQAVLNAIDTAEDQYVVITNDGKATQESRLDAFSKLKGICFMNSLPDWKQRLYHIRNIARKKSGEDWYPQTGSEILALFEEAYNEGDSLDQLEDLAMRGFGYRELPDVLRRWIRESKADRKQAMKEEARIRAEQEYDVEDGDIDSNDEQNADPVDIG